MPRNTAEIEMTPRKAAPTPEYRKMVEAELERMQAVADSTTEALVLKAAFLSDDDDDIRSRRDQADRRERMLGNGWKAVSLWLNPTEIAALGAGTGSKRLLAGRIRSLIAGRAVHGPSVRQASRQEDETVSEAARKPDVVATDRGKLIELWKLKDDTLDGEVISGPIRGARLSSLSFGYLSQLWHETCILKDSRDGVAPRHDQTLLETFLEWRFEGWQEALSAEAQQSAVAAEPYEILGVSPSASFPEVRAAYRKAAMAAHPDRGGNAWLFRQITQAWETIKAAQPEEEQAEEKKAA